MSRFVTPDIGLSYMQFIFPGILGMAILFSSIFSSISIIWDKEFGFMKEILVAPVSRFSIVIGKAASGTLISVIQAAIILGLFPLLGIRLGVVAIVEIIVLSMLLSFCMSALGIVIASFYESFESFSVIINFIVMPMFFLSGAMYPVKRLPDILRIAARLNPFTYGIDALKHAIFRDSAVFDFSMIEDLGVLTSASFVFIIVAGIVFERKK